MMIRRVMCIEMMAMTAVNERRILQMAQMRMHMAERSQQKADVQEQAQQKDKSTHVT